MNLPFRTAYVYVQHRFAGILAEGDEGYTFSYDADYRNRPDASAVSLTLPLREEPYHAAVLFPFFDGLIPEGWLLEVAIRNWKLDRNDRFELLLRTCLDCVGDVSIRPEKST